MLYAINYNLILYILFIAIRNCFLLSLSYKISFRILHNATFRFVFSIRFYCVSQYNATSFSIILLFATTFHNHSITPRLLCCVTQLFSITLPLNQTHCIVLRYAITFFMTFLLNNFSMLRNTTFISFSLCIFIA